MNEQLFSTPRAARRGASDRFLAAAADIGDRLCEQAFWHEGRCNWVGRSSKEAHPSGSRITPTVATLGPDLYGGSAGVALFLAQLHALTGRKAHRDAAMGGMRHALARCAVLPDVARWGLFGGAMGVAFAAARTGLLLDDAPLVKEGVGLASRVAGAPLEDHPLDLIAGNAGAIPALLHLARLPGGDSLVDTAVRLGEEIMDSAIREDGRCSWTTKGASGVDMGPRPLNGLSHGAAGMAAALLELYVLTDHHHFLEGALGAFEYEASTFDERRRDWPDLREREGRVEGARGEPTFMVAWCHGAPGIGLARLRAMKLLPHRAEMRRGAEEAVRVTASYVEARRFRDRSPCHGLAGLTELLVWADGVIGDHGELARTVWLETIEEHGARCDYPSGVASGKNNPSLMLGLAGVGHALLRLHDPERVSSVLLVTG